MQRIRQRLETGSDRVTDLHLWRVGPGHAAVIISILSDRPESPDAYKERLAGIHGLSHVTVEVRQCPPTMPSRRGRRENHSGLAGRVRPAILG